MKRNTLISKQTNKIILIYDTYYGYQIPYCLDNMDQYDRYVQCVLIMHYDLYYIY